MELKQDEEFRLFRTHKTGPKDGKKMEQKPDKKSKEFWSQNKLSHVEQQSEQRETVVHALNSPSAVEEIAQECATTTAIKISIPPYITAMACMRVVTESRNKKRHQ